MKAMILAAGLGTRLKPLTDNKPKALVEIGGMTMLEMTIRYLKKHGINEVVVNVHHFADQVIEYLEKNEGFGLSYQISDERDQLMNTGGALVKAKDLLSGARHFVLTGVDILTDLDLTEMIRFHLAHNPLVTLAVKERNTSRSLLFSAEGRLQGWRDNSTNALRGVTQTKGLIPLGFSAIHLLNSDIFAHILEQGAFSIIDMYLRLMNSHEILGFRHDNSEWMEFGRANELESQMNSRVFSSLISKL